MERKRKHSDSARTPTPPTSTTAVPPPFAEVPEASVPSQTLERGVYQAGAGGFENAVNQRATQLPQPIPEKPEFSKTAERLKEKIIEDYLFTERSRPSIAEAGTVPPGDDYKTKGPATHVETGIASIQGSEAAEDEDGVKIKGPTSRIEAAETPLRLSRSPQTMGTEMFYCSELGPLLSLTERQAINEATESPSPPRPAPAHLFRID